MTTILPYCVRYSNGRNNCTKCGSEIPKGAIQLAIMEQSMTDDCMEPKWFDKDCFFQIRRPAVETVIDGFANLRHTHQLEIRNFLGFSASNSVNPHSSTVEVDPEQPPVKKCNVAADLILEKQIQKQNKDFFEVRGKLKLNTKKDDRVTILEVNDQFVPEGNSEILNHVTDVIFFGAMTPCSVCMSGKFIFKNSIYCCTGNVSEWSKCVNTVTEPKRIPVKIPDKFQKFLRGNFEVHARILKPVVEISDEDYDMHVKQPLFDMEFFIIGETKKSHEDIGKKIKQMGGKLTKEIHENLAAVISNVDEITKMGHAMKKVQGYGIHVVSEEFIDEVKDNNPIELIAKKDLSNWGKDLHKRMPQTSVTVEDLESPSTSGPKVLNMKWKNGGVVDPDSKVADIAHVYSIGDLKYCAILDLVDISSNKNSYFKMQLLESDSGPIYWLFESKGRIATSIGTVSVKSFNNFYDANAAFKSLYLEKTGNEFGTKFVKKPGKYNQMNVENQHFPDHLRGTQRNGNTLPSRLSRSIYRLIGLLFDVNIMESALIGFDLDIGKMPLGKISRSQTDSAMKLLTKISSLLRKTNPLTSNEIIAASNQFYSQIPHNFGTRRPPVINTKEMIQEKYEMLDALQQMEITYYILSGDTDEKVNLMDSYFQRLMNSVEITELDRTTEEFAEISEYVKNTQTLPANTPYYLNSDFELVDVFKVSRHEEIGRFSRFENTPNRQLLWHGTRLTSFVGILTNGLKVDPPLIRISGRRFGQGIYFSDSLLKSFIYCRTHDETILLLLCEVALGQSAVDHQPANGNYDSVKGIGRYYPHPVHVRADGLMVPNGKFVLNNQGTRLMFNEFVVYDESRVKIRYIVKLNVKARLNVGTIQFHMPSVSIPVGGANALP